MDEMFPAPLPDETIYSWICRYSMCAAHSDFKAVTLRKLGVRDSRPSNEFPPFLARLSELAGIELPTLVSEFTNIHYFQPFMDEGQYSLFMNSLTEGDTASIQARIGAVASRITPGQSLKYCPKCNEEDINTFGTAYWHRCHQLVGVTACCKHGTSLFSVRKPSKSIMMPPAQNRCMECKEVEFQLSQLIANELNDTEANWYKVDTYGAYFSRFADMGVLTMSGRIRQKTLRSLLSVKVRLLSKLPPPYPSIAEMLLRSRYPESLFYQRDCNHQPLKHYLLIFALFESWADFKKEVISKKLRYPTTPHAKIEKDAEKVNWEEAIDLVKHGKSLRHVAKQFGTTVSTVKIKAIQRGIAVEKRPSILTSDIEEAIKIRLVNGDKTQDIAIKFGVSVGAVEKVLSQDPKLPTLRKKIWYEKKFEYHQKVLLCYLDNHCDATRNQFKKGFSSSYSWLYKNEKGWLYEKLPARVAPVYWPRKPKECH